MTFIPLGGKITSQGINDLVSWLDSEKLGIDDEVRMNQLSQEIKEALTGGAVPIVGINAVGEENIKNHQVTNDKLSNAKVGKNLFDKNRVTNALLNMSNGTTSSNSGYYTSDYMLINPNTVYRPRYQCRICFYDIDKNFISSGGENTPSPELGAHSTPITSPNDARIARISFRSSNPTMLNTFQFELGSDRTPTEPHYHELRNTIATSEDRVKASDIEFEYTSDGLLSRVIEDNSTSLFFYSNGEISYIIISDNEFNTQKRIDFAYEDGYVKQVTERFL